MTQLVSQDFVATPYFVLLQQKVRVGPAMVETQADLACSPIYAFSDKSHYDLFVAANPERLTPYPLVQLFLREQTSVVKAGLRLVAVDAASPQDPSIQAVTMEAVLEAHERRLPNLPVTHHLMRDQMSGTYRVATAC